MDKQRIIIDTDIGTDVDDALAITLALSLDHLDLVGLTIVDADVETRARMAARLLGMAGHSHVPVAKGASNPLNGGRMPTWLGHEGNGLLDMDYPGPEARVIEQDAADFIIEESKKGPTHVVCIGALSNLARAFAKDPQLSERLSGVTSMGGLIRESAFTPEWVEFFEQTGIVPAHLDHNTASDPEAALQVARASRTMTWVTGELTFTTYLHRAAMNKIAAIETPLAQALVNMVEIWNRDWFRPVLFFPGAEFPMPEDAVACLHDPLTIASLHPGPWLTLEDLDLRFTLEGDYFRIFEASSDAAEKNHSVSTAVNREAFEEFYTDRVVAFLKSL